MSEQGTASTALPAHYRLGYARFAPFLMRLFGLYLLGTVLALTYGEMHHFLLWFVSFITGYMLWTRRVRRIEREENQATVDVMARGEYQEASQRFEALCQRPTSVAAHMMLLFNRASAYQVSGDFERALRLYDVVLQARGRGPQAVMRAQGALLQARIAEAYAWAGHLERAQALVDALEPPIEPPGALVVPTALLRIRSNDAPGAQAALEHGWADAEASLTEIEMVSLRVLHAFVLSELGQEGDEALLDTRQAMRAFSADTRGWMGARWGAMADFLSRLEASLDA